MGAPLELVYMAAMKTLNKFIDPSHAAERGELVQSFRPQAGDWDRVFIPGAAARARSAYAPLWESPPAPLPKPGQTELKVFVAESSEFGTGTPRAKQFPGGFAEIAELLQPGLVWVAWSYLAPGASAGMSYNGLVWLVDRFAWFPKPWKFLTVEPGTAN